MRRTRNSSANRKRNGSRKGGEKKWWNRFVSPSNKTIEEAFLTVLWISLGKDILFVEQLKRGLNEKTRLDNDVTEYEELLDFPTIRDLPHYRELIPKGDARLKDIKIRNKEIAKIFLMLKNPTIDIDELDNVDVEKIYFEINNETVNANLKSARQKEDKENEKWLDTETHKSSIAELNNKRKIANDLLK